jgi:cell division septum initiation protein DivIVA
MTQLALIVKRETKPVPEADWASLISEAAAIKYACAWSGLQDKSVAIEIGVDSAMLSRAKAAQVRLNDDALHALMDSTGCEAPLYAHLLRRGYDPRSLRKLETETERELREARAEVERLRSEREVELRLLKELRNA